MWFCSVHVAGTFTSTTQDFKIRVWCTFRRVSTQNLQYFWIQTHFLTMEQWLCEVLTLTMVRQGTFNIYSDFACINILFPCQWLLPGYAFSEDGEHLAYGTSASGSDWVEIRFLRVDGAKPLEDRLERVKFSCMSWTHDGKGLFYNSYPDQEGKSDGKLAFSTFKNIWHFAHN